LIEFIHSLYNTLALPDFFKDEEELRAIWSAPVTRQRLLERLEGAGFSKTDLMEIQVLIDARESDLFDVLEYIRFALSPVTRKERSELSVSKLSDLTENQKSFIEFLADQYEARGVDELEESRLERLLEAKYSNVVDGIGALGGVDVVRKLFLNFQANLYLPHTYYAAAN
jgi:type I restriction enzyme R subunit